jgi:hypothetical protein
MDTDQEGIRSVRSGVEVLRSPGGTIPVRPMTAAAFGWVLAVGKRDRISCGWSEQGRSRNVPPLMTRAALVICINPKQIKKGFTQLSLSPM